MYFLALTISNLKEQKLVIVFFLSISFTVIFDQLSKDWSVLLAGILSGLIAHIITRENKQ